MSRWEPGALGRLEKAALELFVEDGYEQTTVAEIAARAGVTERTFFRYFTDKREVLFGGGHELEEHVVGLVTGAPVGTAPFDAIASAFEATARDFFADRQSYARQRQAIINSSPDLQERELLKLAALTAALARALAGRGVGEPTASLAAESGVTVFKTSFPRWVSEGNEKDLSQIIKETFAELKAVVTRA
jgi:AcrR family transcriptional regulator